MASPLESNTAKLVIHSLGQTASIIFLERPRYRLGRASQNDLAFPHDLKLSREHLAFEQAEEGWTVRDLGSSNGSQLNGSPLTGTARLTHGDRVTGGDLSIRFEFSSQINRHNLTGLTCFDQKQTEVQTTASLDLATALKESRKDGKAPGAARSHFDAVMRAGRELAGTGSFPHLLDVALDVSLEAVGAVRGVVMTIEDGGELRVCATRGDGFRISTAVRDIVIEQARSLLVQDVALNAEFALQPSIFCQQVQSIIAVPLQTDQRVIGLLYIDSQNKDEAFSPEDLAVITVIANIAAIRIEQARSLEREQIRKLLDQDLARAVEIQRGLLPSSAPHIRGFDCAGYNAPCRLVGGDYYDFLPYPAGRTAVLIGDVSGKGLGAALLMASLQARAQVIFAQPAELNEQVNRLNVSMAASCPRHCFVTFFIALLDPASNILTYCNAGHNSPILIHHNGEVQALNSTGVPLAISSKAVYEQTNCYFAEGDTLVLFSDGVTEACAADEEDDFGEERLIDAVRRLQSCTAAEMVERIRCEVLAFANGLAADDLTLVIARRLVSC